MWLCLGYRKWWGSNEVGEVVAICMMFQPLCSIWFQELTSITFSPYPWGSNIWSLIDLVDKDLLESLLFLSPYFSSSILLIYPKFFILRYTVSLLSYGQIHIISTMNCNAIKIWVAILIERQLESKKLFGLKRKVQTLRWEAPHMATHFIINVMDNRHSSFRLKSIKFSVSTFSITKSCCSYF